MLSLRPLGSTVITRFAATMGRSDSLTDTPADYFFSASVGYPAYPAGPPGPLMFLSALSNRAALFDPGEPLARARTLLGRKCWLHHLRKAGRSRFA
jgi:hypothetical protein